ncbi:MAG: hypothetical protein F6J87_05335 [Spirulina sp. SIO3F2]|nr:hypothetical protein [Spirulina sp. SIO3F2]
MTPNPPGQDYLTPAESAAVDAALLSTPEKFLTRLTISSWRVLLRIAQDQNVAIEALTPEQIIAWFEQDSKTRREQGVDAAVLKWDSQ